MERFKLRVCDEGEYGCDVYMEDDLDGDYVLYDDAQARIAELEKCLKTALEFVPKSVAKRLTVQGGLE